MEVPQGEEDLELVAEEDVQAEEVVCVVVVKITVPGMTTTTATTTAHTTMDSGSTPISGLIHQITGPDGSMSGEEEVHMDVMELAGGMGLPTGSQFPAAADAASSPFAATGATSATCTTAAAGAPSDITAAHPAVASDTSAAASASITAAAHSDSGESACESAADHIACSSKAIGNGGPTIVFSGAAACGAAAAIRKGVSRGWFGGQR